ncbi:type II toxin-antitoxin system RelE/ParE family toxin [Rhodopseudomonas palustris]|uniref:type II toxin-antitoxin system RelE/ParE family toxin n=1 Tax=Rhodopseudomonas palustris TaxID=1076 RepID=UPI002ACDA2C9|nr:type II toxin-antitoxin system RelE/ParE family toxin [Rhodopseudomonas palustris]WQH01886.1 type II toxin-antitoxin system RelE/ParE family toxin [Rhodopseudomonas palustris]
MPVRLTWTKAARDDLLDIYEAIARDQPAIAERTFDRIEAKVDLLGTQPRMGVRRRDIRPALRMLVEAPSDPVSHRAGHRRGAASRRGDRPRRRWATKSRGFVLTP